MVLAQIVSTSLRIDADESMGTCGRRGIVGLQNMPKFQKRPVTLL